MKILFLRFPLQPAWGGAEAHTLTLALGLRERGHEIFLISNEQFLVNAFHKEGLPAKKIWAGWEPSAIWSLLLFPLTSLVDFLIFCFWMVKIGSEVVVCTTLSDKLVATPLAKTLGKNPVWIEHTRIGKWLFQNPFLFWYRTQSKTAKVIAPSYFLRNQLIQAGIPVDRITVIYPGINLDNLKRSEGAMGFSAPLRNGHEVFTVGFLGRLTREKGVEVLLNTLISTGSVAVIAGTGPEENSLKKLAKENGIGNRVKFLGEVADKQKFFSQIDCLIVPSVEAESFGLVIIEAMAAGIPVVASRIGGILEIIEDKKTGLLFEPGNKTELAEKIQFLLKNPKKAKIIKERAALAVGQRFSQTDMVENFLDRIQPKA